jgi:hypothetical protein
MSQARNERRRHQVFITRNSEYHCRDRECVGVKDRTSGEWQANHPALRSRLLGGILNNQVVKSIPEKGFRLVFGKDSLIMTSKVLYRGRPERESIFNYTSLCSKGEILASAASA